VRNAEDERVSGVKEQEKSGRVDERIGDESVAESNLKS
jgi:hypothetical protein